MNTYKNYKNGGLMDDESKKGDWAIKEKTKQGDKKLYFKLKKKIENGSDVTKLKLGDDDGSTILIAASFLGYIDTVRLVLSIPGVDINVKDDNGHTALDLAKNNDIKQLLLDAQNGFFPAIARQGCQAK